MSASKNLTDVCIHVSECLQNTDGVITDWRAIMKYIQDFCFDSNVTIELKSKEQYSQVFEVTKQKNSIPNLSTIDWCSEHNRHLSECIKLHDPNQVIKLA